MNYTIRNREISYKILVSICHPWLSAIPVAYLLFTPAIQRDIRADLQLCRCELFWQSIRFYSHLLMCCQIFLQLLYKLLRGSTESCTLLRSPNLKRWFIFITVTHCTTTTKKSACGIICRLRQQTSPKRWFANANMTSYYDLQAAHIQ